MHKWGAKKPPRVEVKLPPVDLKPGPFRDIKLSHVVNALLTAAILAVAYAQYKMYISQTKIMNNQAKIMADQLAESQAEQRAWVSLAGWSVSSLSSDVNGIRAELSFQIKNTGRNPAVNNNISLDSSISKLPNRETEAAVCAGKLEGFGFSAFPSDQLALGYVSYVRVEELAEHARLHPTIAGIITPTITACVVYKDAVTGIWHHTPYAFRLQMKATKPPRGCCAISLADLPLNGDQLNLMQSPLASSLPPD